MAKQWIYIWDNLISETVTIDGLDIWKTDWKTVKDEKAFVIDPIYGNEKEFQIVEHRKKDGTIIRIAFEEHTPGVYLAYIDNPELMSKINPKPTRKIHFE